MRLISRLSLTARLTLLFAAGSSVVLLTLGGVIAASIQRHFEEMDRDALEGKLMLFQRVIERVASPQDIERLPAQLRDAIVGHQDLVVWVGSPQNEVLLATPNIEFPSDWRAHIANITTTRLFTWSRGEHQYRGLAASFLTGVPARPQLVVAVSVDIRHHQHFMRSFMQTLWLFVACAALVAGLLGWVAASRGLAPLRDMRNRAASVTALKLDQRLPVDAVPPELAELAAALNAMLERLEEAFHRLSDFSSDLAHELRTPISNLMMQTHVTLARARDAASYREVLESNAEEFDRLAKMIADMLFLAKAENGLAIVDRVQVDLASEVHQLFDFYDALAEEKGVRLQLIGEGHVGGNRLMLRRALSNLLSNALRYTPQTGCVTVTIVVDDKEVVLSVENPGETIPPHHLARLFERFYRADSSRQQSAGEGAGLGLAITRAIMVAHRGTMSASSIEGRTCFSIRLPCW